MLPKFLLISVIYLITTQAKGTRKHKDKINPNLQRRTSVYEEHVEQGQANNPSNAGGPLEYQQVAFNSNSAMRSSYFSNAGHSNNIGFSEPLTLGFHNAPGQLTETTLYNRIPYSMSPGESSSSHQYFPPNSEYEQDMPFTRDFLRHFDEQRPSVPAETKTHQEPGELQFIELNVPAVEVKDQSCSHCHRFLGRDAERLVEHTYNCRKIPRIIKDEAGGKFLFACFKCDYQTDEIYSMRGHVRSHTGDKPFYCVGCGKSYTTSRSLNRHKSKKHNGS